MSWSGNPARSIKEVARDSCSSTRLGTHRYSGDDSESGCGTQANTYSDRTRSQGASSDPGEGSLERRLNGRQLYVRRAVDSEGEVLDILVQPLGRTRVGRGFLCGSGRCPFRKSYPDVLVVQPDKIGMATMTPDRWTQQRSKAQVYQIAHIAEFYSALIASSLVLISGLSCKTTFNKELWTASFPLYSMKPNLRNLFMKKLTRDRVVPIISASVS